LNIARKTIDIETKRSVYLSLLDFWSVSEKTSAFVITFDI